MKTTHFIIGMVIISLLGCKKSTDLSQVEETIYVRSNGADMPVYLRGNIDSDVIILLVHGGPGGNALEYRFGKYAEALEAKYGLAYWDQRGQGMSQGVYKKEEVTIDNMVIDLNAVVNTLKSKYGSGIKVIALGHSWGGTLTAKYMVTDDLQYNINGWIEADGAHDIPRLNAAALRKFKNEADVQIALGNNVSNWQGILSWANAIDTNDITDDQGGEINKKAGEVEGWLLADGFIQTGEQGGIKNSLLYGPTNILTSAVTGLQTNYLLMNEVENTALTMVLNKVTIPTLILWGKYDFVVPPALAYDAYNSISSANKKLVIFENSGHSPMDNEWQKFTEEIVAFIDTL
jgi:pimeloyl-ACP methyl ester carboxylesterase